MTQGLATSRSSALEQNLLAHWDARIVPYDAGRHRFAEWMLEQVRRLGHPVASLERLHDAVPEERVYGLSKELCNATHRADFRLLVNQFVLEVVVPEGRLQPPVAVQRFLNVRILLPHRPQGVFPFHTGLLYGHGPASRSLWIPLTDVSRDADRNASMQIIDIARSRELVREAIAGCWSIDEMTARFGAESRHLKAGPGRAVFFSQENIHGNFVNDTGRTRVSIDFRVAEACYGDLLARKIAGGYFGLIEQPGRRAPPPGAGSTVPRRSLGNGVSGRSTILYLHNNTPGTAGAPVHLQRYMLLEYCRRYGIDYHFELFELENMDHLPTLQHIVSRLESNAVLYSVFALPLARRSRDEIFARALASNVALHFVNEDLAVVDPHDRDLVEELLAFARHGDYAAAPGTEAPAQDGDVTPWIHPAKAGSPAF
jgi:sporadic carbohydrate cluster protein (TIGR04323 family)